MTNPLSEFAKSRAGDYLRAVVEYTEDDYEVLYLREDVDARSVEGRFRLVFQELLEEQRRPERIRQTFGPKYGTTHLFPNLYIIHIPDEERDPREGGAVISLDREAGRDLGKFIEECTVRL